MAKKIHENTVKRISDSKDKKKAYIFKHEDKKITPLIDLVGWSDRA